jgi:hypothetical protein
MVFSPIPRKPPKGRMTDPTLPLRLSRATSSMWPTSPALWAGLVVRVCYLGGVLGSDDGDIDLSSFVIGVFLA